MDGRGKVVFKIGLYLGLLVLLVMLGSSSLREASNHAEPPGESWYSFEVVNTYPCDPNAFTQGLVFHDGLLYEGTGLYGQSSLRTVQLETGSVQTKADLERQFFGEGIALLDNKIYQLTWKEHQGFIYDLATLQLTGEFTYSSEGWGLTTDGTHLIMSDGTNRLKFVDPNDFETIKEISVYSADGPVNLLNELEYIKGEIYANVWLTDYIVRIDPTNGRVIAWIDLAGLQETSGTRGDDVLNGIAYDQENDRLFVTGKLWPHLYEIRLKVQQRK